MPSLSLEESIFHLACHLSFYIFTLFVIDNPVCKRVDTDRYAASDLGLYCLQGPKSGTLGIKQLV